MFFGANYEIPPMDSKLWCSATHATATQHHLLICCCEVLQSLEYFDYIVFVISYNLFTKTFITKTLISSFIYGFLIIIC